MNPSALGRILEDGRQHVTEAIDLQSFVGRAPPWAARTVMSVIFAGPGSGRRGPASRLSGGLGREKSRVRGRKARSGEDLVMLKGPFGEVPRPPEPTPLDSPPSRPHRLLESPAYLLLCSA